MIDGFKGFILIILLWLGGAIVRLEMEVNKLKKEARKKGWDVE